MTLPVLFPLLLLGAPFVTQLQLDRLPGPSAPLGRVGDVVGTAPEGGTSPLERVEIAALEGCEKVQAINVTHFLQGAIEAGTQLQEWLARAGAPIELEQKLFGRGVQPLIGAIRRARTGSPSEALFCGGLPLEEGWKLGLKQAPAKLCAGKRGPGARGGAFWFAKSGETKQPGAVTGLVQLTPAPSGAADRCRPRLSAALFDDAGKVRFRYHADFGGEVSAELEGEEGRTLRFNFQAASQTFRPQVGKRRPAPSVAPRSPRR